MKIKRFQAALITGTWIGMAASAATAQTSAETSSGTSGNSVLQEVVVTANRREERLQDVPMSVTAVSGEELTRTQSFDLQDIAHRVPGLDLQQGGGSGYGAFGTRLILRGQNSGGGGSVVATLVDDVPFSFSGSNTQGAFFATDLEPYDMNRIEVLRGPQGTLYGATAEGGLIKYVTNAPDPKTFSAGVDAGGLSIAHGGSGGNGHGYVNIPLVDNTLALRASAYYEQLPGWISDQLNNTRRINNGKRYGGRAALQWEPRDDLTIKAMLFEQVLEVNGNSQVQVNGGMSPDPFGLENGYNFNIFLPNVGANRGTIGSLNVDWRLGWATLQSISSYGHLKVTYDYDIPFYENIFGPGTTLTNAGLHDLKKYSQEVRLVSTPGATGSRGLDWLVGLFYTNEKAPTSDNYLTRGYPAGVPVTTPISPNTPDVLINAVDTGYWEAAAYLDGTYHFTSQLDLEAGARIFHNHQFVTSTQGGLFSGLPQTTTFPQQTSSESKATYSVAPRWHLTPDSMVYVRVASGYRPGGPQLPFPGAPPSVPTDFASDRTVNYELGSKSALLDHRLTLDVAAFYVDWSKIQVPVVIPIGQVAYTPIENVGSAVSKGFEWSVDWIPVTGLTLGTVGAYTNARFTVDAPGVGAKDGDRLAYVPKFSGNVHALYESALGGQLTGYIGGSYSYVGDRYNDFTTYRPTVNSHIKIPAYHTIDAQIGIRQNRYFLEFYGKNLSDNVGITSYSGFGADVTLIPGYVSLIRPRTFGVRVGAEF